MAQSSLDQLLERNKKRKLCEEVNEAQTSIDDVREIEVVEICSDDDEIRCPVCSLDILSFSLKSREDHVEICLQRSASEITTPRPLEEENDPKLMRIESRITRTIKTTKLTKPTKSLTKAKKAEPTKKARLIHYAPDFKLLKLKKSNLKILVDGFNYTHPSVLIDQDNKAGNDVLYFLSHFHSDHYIGLSKGWNKGSIWSSDDSIKLIDLKFQVKDKNILKPLQFDEWIELSTEPKVGVRVKLYDANHCPGGAIFMFEEYIRDTDGGQNILKRILHTGDFRVSYKHLILFKDDFIDEVYLDTTYLNPLYKFPNQSTLVNQTCVFLKDLIHEEKGVKNSILNYFKSSSLEASPYKILIGSYSIGKEKLYIQLAQALKTKIFVTSQKLQILSKIRSLEPILDIFETKNDKDCMIHVVPLAKLKDLKYLEKFKSFKLIKIRPIGWSFNLFQKKVQPKKRTIGSLKEVNVSATPHDQNSENQEKDYDTNTLSLNMTEITPNNSPLVEEKPNTTNFLTKQGTINSLFEKPTQPIEEQIQQSLKAQYQTSSTLQIPYSEHSSFRELSQFGIFLTIGKIIPTVSVNNIKEFEEWFREWKAIGEEVRNDHYKYNEWFEIVKDYYSI